MTRKYAADDANLNTGSLITSRTKKYKDVNLLFAARPGDGDVYAAGDAAAVKQSVRNLILTQYHERPFQPNLGSSLRESLFDLNDTFARYELEESIRECIANHEPRASVKKIRAVPDRTGHTVNIYLEFIILNLQESVTLNVSIERLR